MAIYITTLAILPCADGMNKNHTDVLSEFSNDGHSHGKSDQTDECAPFCICSCCGLLSTLPPSNQCIGSITVSSYLLTSIYSFDYYFDYAKGIWQPPAKS